MSKSSDLERTIKDCGSDQEAQNQISILKASASETFRKDSDDWNYSSDTENCFYGLFWVHPKFSLEDAMKSEERDKKCSAFVHRRGPSGQKCDTRAPHYIPRSLEGKCGFLKRDTVYWLHHFHRENRLEAADVIFIFIVRLTPSTCLLAVLKRVNLVGRHGIL